METFEKVINGEEVTVEYEYTYYHEDETDYHDIEITYVNAYTEDGTYDIDYNFIYRDIYGKLSFENL